VSLQELCLLAMVAILSGCASMTTVDKPRSIEEVAQFVYEKCDRPGITREQYLDCAASIIAEARRSSECSQYINSLPLYLLEEAGRYQMLYGKRPPGIEAVCGAEAYRRIFRELRASVQ